MLDATAIAATNLTIGMLKDERVISWRDKLTMEERATSGSSYTDKVDRSAAMAPSTADRNKRLKLPSSTSRPPGLTTLQVILGLTAFAALALVISLPLGLQSARSLRSTSVLDRLLGKESSQHHSQLDRFIKAETPMAIANILRNIGPAAGAADGLVIASPSWGEWADEPDYYVGVSPAYYSSSPDFKSCLIARGARGYRQNNLLVSSLRMTCFSIACWDRSILNGANADKPVHVDPRLGFDHLNASTQLSAFFLPSRMDLLGPITQRVIHE
jgi:hypothetical protein